MTPEQEGRCIRLGNRLIPATNIYFADSGGVYFEIKFEDGALWVISFNASIEVVEYPKWAMTDYSDNKPVTQIMKTWEEFLALYLERQCRCD